MTDDEIDALLGDDCGDVIVCGMSHTPFHRVIGDVHVINVGSIGEAPDGLKRCRSLYRKRRVSARRARDVDRVDAAGH